MEVISNKKNLLLYRYLLLLIIILFIIISAGWVATDYLGNTAKKDIIKENENAISILSIYFTYTIKEIEGGVETMSGSPWIAPALISRRDQDIAKANSVLDRYNSSLGVSVCYLINSSGVTIASSNRKAQDSFVGNSYKFRPYFTQAMEGNRGQYLALGVTSGKRGAFASHPVRDTQGKIVGVAVIKKDLDEIEIFLSKYPFCFIVDQHGIIFLSSKKEMLSKSFWPINRKTEAVLVASRQFGD
jgi:C4-dicarboxylate-specific signal transduction histidine kinase